MPKPLFPAAMALLTGMAAVTATQAAELATVVSSTPVMTQVAVPRQSCTQGEQYVQQRPSGAGALIGAVAGGLLGSTIGGGFGRAAATGVGVVAGSVIGDNTEANASPVTAVPVRRCQTVQTYENRVLGYDVVYDYAGQRYSARMARDPGRQFPVEVRPVGDMTSVASSPVPVYAEPAPVYYDPLPAPAYVAPYGPGPVVVGPPAVSVGIGYGYYGGRRHWH